MRWVVMQCLVQQLVRGRAVAAGGNLASQREQVFRIIRSQLQELAMPELDEFRGVVRRQMRVGAVVDEQNLSISASFEVPGARDRSLIGEFQLIAFVRQLVELFPELGFQLALLTLLGTADTASSGDQQDQCDGEFLARVRVQVEMLPSDQPFRLPLPSVTHVISFATQRSAGVLPPLINPPAKEPNRLSENRLRTDQIRDPLVERC